MGDSRLTRRQRLKRWQALMGGTAGHGGMPGKMTSMPLANSMSCRAPTTISIPTICMYVHVRVCVCVHAYTDACAYNLPI